MMPGWFRGLAAIIICAILANGVLVWKALHGRHDLVRKDYYEAGLDQDARMARLARAEAPDLGVAFLPDADGFRVMVERKGGRAIGWSPLAAPVCRAEFYRPDNDGEDLRLELIRDSGAGPTSIWRAPAPRLRRGRWLVTLLWLDGADAVMEKHLDYFSPG